MEYALVDTPRGWLILATERVEEQLKIYELEGRWSPPRARAALSEIHFHHPLAKTDAGYDRLSPIYLGDYVTTDTGSGIVHWQPAYGVEDFQSCKAHGMRDADIISPVMGDGVYASWLPLFGGMKIWDANPQIVVALKASGNLFNSHNYPHSYMHCWRHKTRSSTALPRSGSPGWTWSPRQRTARAARPCARRRWPASKQPPSTRPGASSACTI